MRTANLKNLIAACILSLAIICTASGDIIYVNPGEFIQAAIDDANEGDLIEVAPGTYYEAINFNGKAIRLYSIGGPDVTIIDANGLNSTVVKCVSGEDANTTLEGFTITGGKASNGGGMNNNGSNPTVTNCTFSSNSAGHIGGGMFNVNSSPVVTDCTFSGNLANSYCGMYNGDSSPTVTKCRFIGNTAIQYGGGMGNDGGSATVSNCIFINNSAGDWGGGMENFMSGLTMTNCTFIGNSAPHGGGMMNYNSSSMKVTNCIFIGNKAPTRGGGMLNIDNNMTVTNCTFTGNQSPSGGGMNNNASSPTVTNCIMWGDTPNEIYNQYSSPNVTYSDVQGDWAGTGNINADPGFVNAAVGNLRLSPGSPCIDKGSNAAVPSGITADLDGSPRIIDGDCDDIDVVDMGAYEFVLAYFGDFDNDCSVNFFDISILARAWMTQEGDPDWDLACDISDPPDDYINWRDAAVLCENWLENP